MSALKKEYPQAEQSRQMLSSALIKLMKIKPYKEISVAELSEKADLSRRTFYRHFNTIDDVLNYRLEKIAKDFSAYFWNTYDDSNIYTIVKIFFSFWSEHKEFLFTLQKNNMLYLLLDRVMPAMRKNIRKMVPELLKENLTHHERTAFENSLEQIEYIFYFMAGGTFNLLVHWIENGASISANDMAEIATEAIRYFSQ